MNTSRKIAITVGVLYLTANIAGPIALGLEGPILGAPDYLANVSANESQYTVAMLFGFIMAIAIAGIGPAFYPVLRRHNESIAIGYVAARIIEGMIQIVGQISALSLVTLSHEFVNAGAPIASYFQTLGELLLAVRAWGGGTLGSIVFWLGALSLYYLLYQSRLIPRWLSVFGGVAATLGAAAVFLAIFGLITTMGTIMVSLSLPLFVAELALALWLIVKGFNPSVTEAS